MKASGMPDVLTRFTAHVSRLCAEAFAAGSIDSYTIDRTRHGISLALDIARDGRRRSVRRQIDGIVAYSYAQASIAEELVRTMVDELKSLQLKVEILDIPDNPGPLRGLVGAIIDVALVLGLASVCWWAIVKAVRWVI